MRQRTRLVARHFGRRDARLIVVATEGARTEPLYFDALKLNNLIDRNRVVVEVVATGDDHASAPEYVLERLKQAVEPLGLKEFDETWLVLDVDRWGDKKLAQVARAAAQMGARLAVSNPSFEVWLLLHVQESSPSSQREIEARLREVFGRWSKTRVDATWFPRERVAAAAARARSSANDRDRWPVTPPGTHMHRLLASIAPDLG